MKKRMKAAAGMNAAGMRRAKGAAAWIAAACCALGAAAEEPAYTNGAVTIGRVASGPFVMNIEEGIRVVRPGSVEITYSDRWDGQAGGTGAAEVTAEGETLATVPGEGEGVCVWAPVKTGVNILTHTCGGRTLTAKLFLPGATNKWEKLTADGSGPFRMDIQNGIRPVPFATVTGITYSDRWDGGNAGSPVSVSKPDQAPFYSAEGGEDVCDWTPAAPGFNTLRHTCVGKELTAHFLVMPNVRPGKEYDFQLAEPEAISDSAGEQLCAGPYTWAPAEDSGLPDGLTLGEDGKISGRAACGSGIHFFTAVITPTTGEPFEKTYPLLVLPSGTVFILG